MTEKLPIRIINESTQQKQAAYLRQKASVVAAKRAADTVLSELRVAMAAENKAEVSVIVAKQNVEQTHQLLVRPCTVLA